MTKNYVGTFYVNEYQHRPDGTINEVSHGCSTFASGNSKFHERITQAFMSTQFTDVNLELIGFSVDADGNRVRETIETKDVHTQYKPAEE